MQIQLAKIKADILCELIAVSIIRSEFDEAEMVGLLPSMLSRTLNSPTGNKCRYRAHSHMECV